MVRVYTTGGEQIDHDNCNIIQPAGEFLMIGQSGSIPKNPGDPVPFKNIATYSIRNIIGAKLIHEDDVFNPDAPKTVQLKIVPQPEDVEI